MLRDAVLDLVPRLEVGVPQGRGRFDAEARNETAEKNRDGRNKCPYHKLTQVDEANSLRRSRQLPLRN
jgi:hypothetical protein